MDEEDKRKKKNEIDRIMESEKLYKDNEYYKNELAHIY